MSTSIEDDRTSEWSTDPRQLYGRWYYGTYSGIAYEDNDHWRSFFGGVADSIVRLLAPQRLLDAGCAKGFLVGALRQRGVDATGFDLSELAIAEASATTRPHLEVGSLLDPIDGRFDLVCCIEVIEHLDPADTPVALANLCAASDSVLLSSTPADLHEPSHVNVQPTERWSQLFAAHGFFRDFRHDATYLSPWAALYRRANPSLTDLVVDYDRAWSQLRTETLEQRRALLALQERCEALQPDRDLEDESTSLRNEILRMRDALIGQEAELGTARGRAVELEAELRRCEAAANHLDAVLASRSWRMIWSLGWPLRALRGRQ